MKLFRHRKRWSDDPQLFHLVLSSGWKSGTNITNKLADFHVSTYCGNTNILGKGDDHVEYEKDKHKKSICMKCYEEFNNRRKASLRARAGSLSPEPSPEKGISSQTGISP